ncbi:MAG: hypothetical protein ABL936_25510 [Aestuariivirga sp.]
MKPPKRKATSTPVQPWTGEMPTPERTAKAGEAVTSHKTEEGRTALRFTDGDILEHMQSRGMIDGDQYGCGKRYYRDWFKSGLAASGVVDPGRIIVDGGNPEPAIIRQMEFAQEWAKASRAVGKVLCHPLTDMVLLDEPATAYAMRHLGMKDPKDARLSAYTMLKMALDALVMYYMGPRRMRASYHRGDHPQDRPDLREAS